MSVATLNASLSEYDRLFEEVDRKDLWVVFKQKVDNLLLVPYLWLPLLSLKLLLSFSMTLRRLAGLETKPLPEKDIFLNNRPTV